MLDVERAKPGEDGYIKVRDVQGEIHPVSTPGGFSDYFFRQVVAAASVLYLQHGKIPTVEQMSLTANRGVHDVAQLVLTEEFKSALSYRGIEWDASKSGLSLEQTMVIIKLADPTDRRSTGAKLGDLGIPVSRHQAWLKNPLYASSITDMAEANLRSAVPIAINKLVGNAEAGDQRAIELILAMTNRWNPAQQQVEDARYVVTRVVEAIIKIVKDPETRLALLSEIQAEAVGFAVKNPSLEG